MSEKTSFWKTLPGILTGIAAVIGALGGLYLGLCEAGIICDRTPDSEGEVTPSPTPVQFSLIISTDGDGSTNPNPGSYTYIKGTQVPITALPSSDCEFDYWSGDYSGTSSTINITMDGNKSVTAHFKPTNHVPPPPPAEFSLTISVDSNGGTTDPSPGIYTHGKDSMVRIEALPQSNWRFYHWSGDRSDKSRIITVTMDSDKKVAANFIIYSEQTQFIAARPNFNSLINLDGRKIRVSSTDELAWKCAEVALSTYDITLIPVYVPPQEIYQSLQLGMIDAVLVYVYPWPGLDNMINDLGLRLFSWSDQAISEVIQEFPQVTVSALPAGTYSGQRDDIFGYAPR